MAVEQTPRPAESRSDERGAFSPKLPREALLLHQKDLKSKALSHPLYKEAALKNFKIGALNQPFGFDDSTEIVNNQITFRYEKDKEDTKIGRFYVTKSFSLSGPMQYKEGVKDKGPFVKMEGCLTFNDKDPHISYSFTVSENDPKKPRIYHEDTQEAVNEFSKHLNFLPF